MSKPDAALVTELIELSSSLVSVPSLSGDEANVQRTIASWFSESGMKAVIEPAEGGLSNVVAEIEGAGEGPTIFIGGHCDTVSPAPDYSFDPYAPFVRDGRLYGVGAMDMKAGLAVAMHVVRDFFRRRGEWKGRIIFAALADEEAYSRGAYGFVAKKRKIDAAIMCEPHPQPSIAGIGKINIRIEVTGVSAHGSHPGKGVNAVVEAGKLLAAIDGITHEDHPKYGKASHCVLNITSGDRPYEIRVPDYCAFMINWHFMPGETAEEAVELLGRLVAGLHSKAKFDITIAAPRYDAYELSPTHPVVTAFAKSFAAISGNEPDYDFCYGVSDANIFNAHGIPTILSGPRGANMHAADEWVEIEQMAVAHAVYSDFLARFLLSNA